MESHIKQVIKKFEKITEAINSGNIPEELKPYIPALDVASNMDSALTYGSAYKENCSPRKIYTRTLDSFISAYFPHFPKDRAIADLNALSENFGRISVIDTSYNFDLDFYTLCILPLIKIVSYNQDTEATTHNRSNDIFILTAYGFLIEPIINLVCALSKALNISVVKRTNVSAFFHNRTTLRVKTFGAVLNGFQPNFMIFHYRKRESITNNNIPAWHEDTIMNLPTENAHIFQLDDLDGVIEIGSHFVSYKI